MPPPPPPFPPGAPSAHHTPKSVGLPAHTPQLTPSTSTSTAPRASLPPRPPTKSDPSKPKHVPRLREPDEEKKAYGRRLGTCGKLSDYQLVLKIGEGTFGEVHKAVHKTTNETVALKRIFMHSETEGVPITALREIRILKALKHENVLSLVDAMISRSKEDEKPTLYMVFPYMDYDLAGLLENKEAKLTTGMIKMFMQQLCRGTEYLHRNNILHRDMKAANLLISKTGQLIIADFGLARPCDAPDLPSDGQDYGTRFTNMVVTRWYRPPELLLGARYYDGAVDMWGIGCIFAEMFTRSPILRGNSDGHQFMLIIELCGTPTEENWPTCPGFSPDAKLQDDVPERYNFMSDPLARKLLDDFLVLDPAKRLTATDALAHDYFYANPPPMDLGSFPQWAPSHEYDKRRTAAPPQQAASHVPAAVRPPVDHVPPPPPYMSQRPGPGPAPGPWSGPPQQQWANGPGNWNRGPPQQQWHGGPPPAGRGRNGPGPPQQHNMHARGRGYGPGPPRGGAPGPVHPMPPQQAGLPPPITLAPKNDFGRRASGPVHRGGGPGGGSTHLPYH
ncbi:Pkinase-domain-containing protein [Exidia glandulosa HHB12029]|uniref:Pkinase-domain-containing protein n=1 Tax=Exidia glandulosa HHB12029 TaxID=1314781 RepID=A0A165EYD0_EXIGL|nr:Pkinase-domain-containing protein [Exidia glandulosa HHB12029]